MKAGTSNIFGEVVRRLSSLGPSGVVMISSIPRDVIKKPRPPPEISHIRQVKGPKKAAVLVPLCTRHGVPSILFTVRSDRVSSHKGHVSFPGGHIDEGEDAVSAAFRETREELGVGVGEIECIGKFERITAVTGTLVTPIIGIINKDVGDFENLDPSVDEVAKVFTRSIEQLLDGNFRKKEKVNYYGQEFQIPYFGEKGDQECIWGLTAIVLDSFLSEVVEPSYRNISKTHLS